MGGGDDPDVGADRRAPADRGVLALLQDPQQARLRLQRHVADLVQEQRAALRLLEAAGGAHGGAGEGPLLVAEQLGLDQFARDRRHVDRDERSLAPLAVIVQRTRDQFLAGPGLAGDHDGQVGAHQPRQHPVDVLHGGGTADQGQRVVGRRWWPGLAGSRRRRCWRRQRLADRCDQLVEVERLREVFESPPLAGLHGGQERVLGAHHDHPQFRAGLAGCAAACRAHSRPASPRR